MTSKETEDLKSLTLSFAFEARAKYQADAGMSFVGRMFDNLVNPAWRGLGNGEDVLMSVWGVAQRPLPAGPQVNPAESFGNPYRLPWLQGSPVTAGRPVQRGTPVSASVPIWTVTAPNSNSPYVLFNKTHAGSQPVPKGLGPNGGRLQSHHGLQVEWAANNLPGYDPKLAPTVTIETGKGFPHTRLSNLQNARRDARAAAGLGKWSSSIDDELGFIVSDFRQAGFGDDVVRQVLEQNYRMLDKLGVRYTKPAGF